MPYVLFMVFTFGPQVCKKNNPNLFESISVASEKIQIFVSVFVLVLLWFI